MERIRVYNGRFTEAAVNYEVASLVGRVSDAIESLPTDVHEQRHQQLLDQKQHYEDGKPFRDDG